MHVGGLHAPPSSRVEHPARPRRDRKDPRHLVALGVTDVELLPVTAFDVQRRAGARRARSG